MVRIVTASSLFDGHDASINIMRRIMQDQGAEVIHLGHNRSVLELVTAVLQEGAQAVAVSSYQGGHVEYFKYMRDSLDALGAPYVRIFGGGGGVITWAEKKELEAYGISKIFHPDEGRELGLEGMIQLVLKECEFDVAQPPVVLKSRPTASKNKKPVQVKPTHPTQNKTAQNKTDQNKLAQSELVQNKPLQITPEQEKESPTQPAAQLDGQAQWPSEFYTLPHRELGLLVHSIEQKQNKNKPAAPVLSVEQQVLSLQKQLAASATQIQIEHSKTGQNKSEQNFHTVKNIQPLVLGITGTGGSGKSSLTDELVGRVLNVFPQARVAVFCTDPTKKKTGGALLGDRIRMNFLDPGRVYMRSLASRQSGTELSSVMPEILKHFKTLPFDLLIVESSGIGQAGSQILELADLSLYVMTAEFGAQSQLEKIDMIDYADLVAINKADRQGAQDAYHDVKKQYLRSRKIFNTSPDTPSDVFLTQSSNFNDTGVNELFFRLCEKLNLKQHNSTVNAAGATKAKGPQETNQETSPETSPEANQETSPETSPEANQKTDKRADQDVGQKTGSKTSSATSICWQLATKQKQHLQGRPSQSIVPQDRQNYLASVVQCVQQYHERVEKTAQKLSQLQAIEKVEDLLSPAEPQASKGEPNKDLHTHHSSLPSSLVNSTAQSLAQIKTRILDSLSEADKNLISSYDKLQQQYKGSQFSYQVRDKTITQPLLNKSLSGLDIKRISLPRLEDAGDRYRYLALENVPGHFPFTAGVYPLKRTTEEATRMFAGLGTPEQTNQRFHFLSKDSEAKRLSTAFDSVTLYGEDPAARPDIYGKIGESGVSIATLDDMKRLYKGFDLCASNTSVSMTINGPAPLILAFFLNTAIDAAIEKKQHSLRRDLTANEVQQTRLETLQTVRGTLQADILKEDQGQNTCIFSTDFALKLMGDVQEYFIRHKVRNFYSVSISGYHIAEAGANPITQLAFTLSNAFTFIEYYLHRGFKIDEFAPNLSFFFSNGLDPEYMVMGRVARRIWALVLRDIYKANARSQKLKYHIQTSGRSLHAQEMSFNDIRTTLQAWLAISDHCNSLHTNAFDEALTTPTQASVRRAQAIQMILQKEFGFNKNENPLQGSYFCQQLTQLVERAVLDEMLRINERGGVLGAMERQYQRSRIQEESLYYEHLKHSGELPIVGVNTFLNPAGDVKSGTAAALERCSGADKTLCLERTRWFKAQNRAAAALALEKLKNVALEGGNIFEELMLCARVCTLGQMSTALYEVGGRYRRNL